MSVITAAEIGIPHPWSQATLSTASASSCSAYRGMATTRSVTDRVMIITKTEMMATFTSSVKTMARKAGILNLRSTRSSGRLRTARKSASAKGTSTVAPARSPAIRMTRHAAVRRKRSPLPSSRRLF